MRISAAIFVFLVTLLSGCDQTLSDYLNKKFPPISIESQRQRAISSSAEALRKMGYPNFAVGISISELEKLIASEDWPASGISHVTIASSDQLLKIEIEFKRTFSDTGNPTIDRLTPEIEGTVILFAGLTGSAQSIKDYNAVLDLKLLPAFQSLRIKRVRISEKYDITIVGDILATVLTRYAENVTGEINKLQLPQIAIPAQFADVVDPNKVLTVSNNKFDGTVTLTGTPKLVNVTLRGIAPIIDDHAVTFLGVLAPASFVPPPFEGVLDDSADGLKKYAKTILSDRMALSDLRTGIWVAIRTDIISSTINELFKQAGLCVKPHGRIPLQTFDNTIAFPDENTVDCTPTRDCTPARNCDAVLDCTPTRDCDAETDCSGKKYAAKIACEAGKSAKKLACETAKTTAKGKCETEKAGKKLDCERLKSTERLQCESEKTGERALCETGKEALKRLSRTGKFATFKGEYTGDLDMSLCFNELTFSQDLKTVQATIDVAGMANANVSMKFIPLDIVGHLTCVAPWTTDQNFKIELAHQSVKLDSQIRLTKGADTARYEFAIPETNLNFNLKPTPAEFLLTNVNLNITCAGMHLLRPLIITAAPFVKQLRGEISYPIDKTTTIADIKIPKIQHRGQTLMPNVIQNDRAVVLQGHFETK